MSRGLENTLDLDGRTPLMWATARGIISGISALKTSFLEAKDAQGYTALHIAGTIFELTYGLQIKCLKHLDFMLLFMFFFHQI